MQRLEILLSINSRRNRYALQKKKINYFLFTFYEYHKFFHIVFILLAYKKILYVYWSKSFKNSLKISEKFFFIKEIVSCVSLLFCYTFHCCWQVAANIYGYDCWSSRALLHFTGMKEIRSSAINRSMGNVRFIEVWFMNENNRDQ